MPYRNPPPEWLQALLDLLWLLPAVLVGMTAKWANEVKTGKRERFWSAKLLLELPALLMMWLLAYGASEWWILDSGPALALATGLGWAGPRLVDAAVDVWLYTRPPNDGGNKP